MLFFKKKNFQQIKLNEKNLLDDSQMKTMYGSGNSQIRYIPNDFVQTKIMNDIISK